MHELAVSYHLITEEGSSYSPGLHCIYTVRIGNTIKLINTIKRIGTNFLNQVSQKLCPVTDRCELGLKLVKNTEGKGTKRKRIKALKQLHNLLKMGMNTIP